MGQFNLQVDSEPIQSKTELQDFIREQKKSIAWESIAIVADKDNSLVILVDERDQACQILRLCLELKTDMIEGLKTLNNRNTSIKCYAVTQGIGDIKNLGNIQSILDSITVVEKTVNQSYSAYFDFKNKGEGRGKSISASVARDVVFESHGYCMFEGCGKDLTIDSLTGVTGNYQYLAHIVASSSDGPRGNENSHLLSDDQRNIMILCDKHHRLVDKIAVGDYPENRLTEMKCNFIENCKSSLQSLRYSEVTVFTAFWPIGSFIPQNPDSKEYATALSKIKSRPTMMKHKLLDSRTEECLDDEWWAKIAPRDLNLLGKRFSTSYDSSSQSSAIFALGPSSLLIGLGAVLGNKNNLFVVPKSRMYGWGWGSDTLSDSPITFNMDELKQEQSYEEVVVTLFTTDTPEESLPLIKSFQGKGIPKVEILPLNKGNDSLRSLVEINAYRELIIKQFHLLRNQYKVKRIHLLHCASNVASIELGRAIEHNHPSMTVYENWKEENNKYFVPRLAIVTGTDKVEIESITMEEMAEYHQLYRN